MVGCTKWSPFNSTGPFFLFFSPLFVSSLLFSFFSYLFNSFCFLFGKRPLHVGSGIKRCIFLSYLQQINFTDPKFARYLESTIANRDLVAFTFESTRDMNLFLRTMRNELGLKRVNAICSPPSNAHFQPPCSIESLRYVVFVFVVFFWIVVSRGWIYLPLLLRYTGCSERCYRTKKYMSREEYKQLSVWGESLNLCKNIGCSIDSNVKSCIRQMMFL